MVYNFSAGPAVIYKEVLNEVKNNIVDYKGVGYSLIEASHRSKLYDEVHNKTLDLLATLLNINREKYHIVFLGGGATLQFSMLAYNFLQNKTQAQYIVTGAWGEKAYNDAKKVGDAQMLYDGGKHNYKNIPKEFPSFSAENHTYTHITTNETIGGLQWHTPPNIEGALVADMSSDFLSSKFDINKYSLIYAGAQKNVGPAGLTIVIIKKDFLHTATETLPSYLSYKTHVEKNSLYNTPPVFSIWVAGLVFQHIKTLGGLASVEKTNIEKAQLLYSYIDSSEGFYKNFIEPEYRSKMNVVFHLPNKELEQKFIEESTEKNLLGLKGHRSVGGCRASLYNAMPLDGVQALVRFMQTFCKHNS